MIALLVISGYTVYQKIENDKYIDGNVENALKSSNYNYDVKITSSTITVTVTTSVDVYKLFVAVKSSDGVLSVANGGESFTQTITEFYVKKGKTYTFSFPNRYNSEKSQVTCTITGIFS